MTPTPPPPPRPTPAARRRGAALLVVLFAMLMVSSLAIAFQTASTTSTAVASNIARQAEARGVAESGLVAAMAYVRAAEDWRDQHTHGVWTADVAFAGGTFAFRFDDEDGDLADDVSDPFTITARGTVGGGSHLVSARVTPAITLNNTLLLVVGTDPLSAKDEALRSLFEGWNYHVLTVVDSASQSTYHEAVSEADVIYISEEVNSGSVAGKLDDTTLGVVCEEPYLQDSFGFTNGNGPSFTGSSTTVVNNSHYITSPFATGELTIADGSTALTRFSSSPASGAVVLAETSGGTVTLATLDHAATRADSSANPGRRVMLPVGGSNFHPDHLNADGRTILRRSLEWAAMPPDDPTPIAHWTLDETTGLTAYDSIGSAHGAVGGGDWVTAKVAGGLALDGSTGFVRVPSSPTLQVQGALSITGWARFDGFDSGDDVEVILRKGEGNPNNYALQVINRRPALSLDAWDQLSQAYEGDTVLQTGEWYHLAATWDGETVRIYVNGEADNGSGDSHDREIGTDTRALYLGGRADTDQTDGIIDDVRLYDRALTAAEVALIYQNGLADAAQQEPRLIVEYDFVETKRTPQLVGHWMLDDDVAAGGGALADDAVRLYDTARIDSYDSGDGAYGIDTASAAARVASRSTGSYSVYVENSATIFGNAYCGEGGWPSWAVRGNEGTITGDRLAMDNNPSIPNPSLPGDLPDSSTDVVLGFAYTLTSDQARRDLTIPSGGVLTVSGHRRIKLTDDLRVTGTGRIQVPSGSSLTIYVADDVTIEDTAWLNGDGADPGRLTIIAVSSGSTISISDDAAVGADLHSNGDIVMTDDAVVYGRVVAGDDLYLYHRSFLHLDLSMPGLGIDDPAVWEQIAENAGLARGGVSGGAAGASGDALSFNGSSGYVEVAHRPNYLLDHGCLAFWFYPTNSSSRGLVGKAASGYGDGGHLQVSFGSGRKVVATLGSASSTYTLQSGSVALNQWHHVAVSFGAGGLRLIVNGDEVDSDPYTGGLGPSSGGEGNEEPWAFGADTSSTSAGSLSGLSGYWGGRLDDVRLYDFPLDAGQAADVMAGQPLGPSTLESPIVYDVSGYSAALNLMIDDLDAVEWQPGGGLVVTDDVVIASTSAAPKVHAATAATGEVTVEAWVRPAASHTAGTATIASYAGDSSDRNVTLSQRDTDADVRLRTGSTGSAGTPAVTATDALAAGAMRKLVATYNAENEEVRFYVDGVPAASADRSGGLGWDADFRLFLAGEASGGLNWTGTFTRLAIFDRAVNQLQVTNMTAGLDPGPPVPDSVDYRVRWVERP